MRPTKYDAATLAPIVASSTSLAEVMRKLRLAPNGGNHRMISARIRRAGLDTSHFGGKLRARIEQISRERLVEIVVASSSVAEVLAALELPTKGRAHHELTHRLAELCIDTSHFRGQGWSLGKTKSSHDGLARGAAKRTFSDEELFVENGPLLGGPAITKRLLARGWTYDCSVCGISEWCGRALVLHLDHINGVNNDNQLSNLRLLCPNCHSQTDTYCNRKRATASRACEARARYTCYTSAHQRAWWNR